MVSIILSYSGLCGVWCWSRHIKLFAFDVMGALYTVLHGSVNTVPKHESLAIKLDQAIKPEVYRWRLLWLSPNNVRSRRCYT